MSSFSISKNFIVAKPETPISQIKTELVQKGGNQSWYLVIEQNTGTFQIASFSEISDWKKGKNLNKESALILLDEFGGPMHPVDAIDEDVMDENLTLAKDVMLVTWINTVNGVLINRRSNEEVEKPTQLPTTNDRLRLLHLRIKASYQKSKIPYLVSGFLLIYTLFFNHFLPVIGFDKSESFPKYFPREMTGEWNIVIAGFQPIGDHAMAKKQANLISQSFYSHFALEMEDVEKLTNFSVQIIDPENSPIVSGKTTLDRERSASKLASKMNADLIIYGVIETIDGNYLISPEFYVNSRNILSSEEFIGQHILGADVNIPFLGKSNPITINVSRELSKRSQVMACIAKGLGLYLAHQYEDSLVFFQKANEDNLWQLDTGREVIYLFVGNSAGKTGDIFLAEDSYRKALYLDNDYARAYIGLGGVHYYKALENVKDGNLYPDQEEMVQALEFYKLASSIEGQPETANILEKAALGMGQIYLSQWLAGRYSQIDSIENEKFKDDAIQQFDYVISQYNNEQNPRLQELASEANARLGLIYREIQQIDLAINYYIQAKEIATNPGRRGLYSKILAEIYDITGNKIEMRKCYEDAVKQYIDALSSTYDAEQREEYKKNIEECLKGLEDSDQT